MENQNKKSGGCFRQGCGTIVMIAAIAFFIVQCGPSLLLYFTEEPESQSESQTPAVVSTEDTQPKPVIPEPPSIEETTPEKSEPEENIEEVDVLSKTIEEQAKSDVVLTREYAWEYGEWEYTWSLEIPEAAYDYFKRLPRPPTMDYSVYVTHPLDDPYISALTEKLMATAERDGFSEFQTVEMVISFVQSLPYTFDSTSTPYDDYPRYPLETLVDNGGDCEDTSILLASLLEKMGYGVVLLDLPNHVAVGVKGGENVYGTYWQYGDNKYYYIETTGSGWRIGQLPEEYEDATARIYPLVPVPIIQHEWDLEAAGTYIELKVKVTNLGTAAASGLYVYTGFDSGGGTGWSSKESDTFDLEVGHEVTATMYLLPPPPGQHVRLMVWIVMGEYKIDESYSIWIDT